MTSDRKLDWRSKHDPKSRDYAMRSLLTPDPSQEMRFWTEGSVLDQGREGACVGFGWMAELLAEPITPNPAPITAAANQEALDIYHAAKLIDEIPGEDYSGTSVLAGAKIMQSKGYITEYRWCFSLDDLRDTILNYGPVVIGIPWYSSMYEAPGGLVTVSGDLVGGHCITITGYHPNIMISGVIGEFYRWRNSWGPDYGIDGSAFISATDLWNLLKDSGEMCVPVGRTLPQTEQQPQSQPEPQPAEEPQPEEREKDETITEEV